MYSNLFRTCIKTPEIIGTDISFFQDLMAGVLVLVQVLQLLTDARRQYSYSMAVAILDNLKV